MKKIIICSFVLLIICSTLFSQTSINETILDSFDDYSSDIRDYFSYYYREDYSSDMLYYNSQLMSIFFNITHPNMISDEIIDYIIELYEKTIALEVPDKDKEMYIKTGLGEKGHELYTKILSIMYFMDLERNINNFTQTDQAIAKNSINKLKNLFSQQDWDMTVNYFKKKYYSR
jgi:hypothetical protein